MSRTTTHTHDCAICGQRFDCWGTWQPNADCPPYCDAFEFWMTYICPVCRGIAAGDPEDQEAEA